MIWKLAARFPPQGGPMLTFVLALLLVQEPPPTDPLKDFEREADRILAACAAFEEKFTLGAAGECLQQAKMAAAAAERAGDAKAPALIHAAAIDRISKAVKEHDKPSSELRRLQNQLEKGRKRAAAAPDEAKKEAALRYALDRATLVVNTAMNESVELVNMGIECSRNGLLDEAEDALVDGESKMSLLRASTWEATSKGPRMAPVLLSRVRAALGRFKEAADDLRRGVERCPEWLEETFDGKEALHAKPEDHDKLVKSLESRGEDVDALLLLAHERYFSKDRAKSKDLFERVLKKKPGDSAAKAFLEKLGN
jgi:tetratricopeptide (TPR) repeat protein